MTMCLLPERILRTKQIQLRLSIAKLKFSWRCWSHLSLPGPSHPSYFKFHRIVTYFPEVQYSVPFRSKFQILAKEPNIAMSATQVFTVLLSPLEHT